MARPGVILRNVKLAYVLDTYPSLTETFLSRELEGLRNAGVPVEIFAISHAGPGAHAIPGARSLLARLRSDSLGRWEAAGRNLARMAAFQGITHVHSGWANYPALVARSAARAARLPWSFAGHARDIWVNGQEIPDLLKTAQFAICCTRAGTAYMQAMSGAAPVHYMPHGLNLEQFSYRQWWPDREPTLLGVGRLVPKKGWDILLDALEEPELAGYRVELIGDGPERARLETLVQRRGREGQVNLRGAVPEEQVREAMGRCGCLVLPSRVAPDGDRDGLANVLLEAAACGLPIVTTDAGAARDLVDESTGRLAWHGDARNLARTIRAVFTEPQITRTRCQAARARVEEQFSQSKNVAKLAELFAGGA